MNYVYRVSVVGVLVLCGLFMSTCIRLFREQFLSVLYNELPQSDAVLFVTTNVFGLVLFAADRNLVEWVENHTGGEV